MKWLLLFALISCTSQETRTEKTPTEPEVATESDSKPVSPYSVEPCYCMKIFKPVCAGNKNYGNSCEAECHGHTTWTEGPCGGKPVQ
jgi:hypothetical protein